MRSCVTSMGGSVTPRLDCSHFKSTIHELCQSATHSFILNVFPSPPLPEKAFLKMVLRKQHIAHQHARERQCSPPD